MLQKQIAKLNKILEVATTFDSQMPDEMREDIAELTDMLENDLGDTIDYLYDKASILETWDGAV